MTRVRKLLLATGNPGKIGELAAMLPGIELVSLRDVSPIELLEPGEDYVTNASAKAIAASRELGYVTIADDSGLEVDALGGAPGWYSARFGGGHGDDRANRERLLDAMSAVPDGARRARFRCVVAVADVHGALGSRVMLAFGTCEGSIALAPRGSGGFGYDPILRVAGHEHTMAELSAELKNRISHRARAVAAIHPALVQYLRA